MTRSWRNCAGPPDQKPLRSRCRDCNFAIPRALLLLRCRWRRHEIDALLLTVNLNIQPLIGPDSSPFPGYDMYSTMAHSAIERNAHVGITCRVRKVDCAQYVPARCHRRAQLFDDMPVMRGCGNRVL